MARPKAKGDNAPYPPGWEPFLSAINADLDDDSARLVFADWLQENGDEPRAEFIRVQCAFARGEPDRGRADALLTEHRARWLRGLPRLCIEYPERCVFRRGLVAALTVRGRDWLSESVSDGKQDAGGKAIRQITALEELHIEQVWNTVVERPTLKGLRALTLPSAGSGLIESLAKSPALPSLVELSIQARSSNGVSQRSFRAVFGNKKLAGLRRLHVESMTIGNVIAESICAPHFAGLQELRLRRLGIDGIGASTLAKLPATGLRVIDLHNNPIGNDGLRGLLAAPAAQTVEELCLTSCRLTVEAVRALAAWPGLGTVRVLDLRANAVSDTDAREIANSTHARNLTDLRTGRLGR
ncbi:MAG TPA: TIGR02996 domain-containing protein [Gemmata sp.]